MSEKESFDSQIQKVIPLKRPQTAEDIGNAVVFLASAEAENITGQALNVDGGAVFS
jgi:enoyl-[acyl-carrier-protein] reductase (NADH)